MKFNVASVCPQNLMLVGIINLIDILLFILFKKVDLTIREYIHYLLAEGTYSDKIFT